MIKLVNNTIRVLKASNVVAGLLTLGFTYLPVLYSHITAP